MVYAFFSSFLCIMLFSQKHQLPHNGITHRKPVKSRLLSDSAVMNKIAIRRKEDTENWNDRTTTRMISKSK